MTSLGSYGTATVLECDTLITNNVKNSNNGILTSVYGQLKLPADEPISNASAVSLKTWINDPASSVKGVTIDNTTGEISLAETGLYLLNANTQFRAPTLGSQSQSRLKINRFGGSSNFLMTARFLANASINREISLTINYLLRIDDIRDTFEIDVFNTGATPLALDDGTFIQIIKLL